MGFLVVLPWHSGWLTSGLLGIFVVVFHSSLIKTGCPLIFHLSLSRLSLRFPWRGMLRHAFVLIYFLFLSELSRAILISASFPVCFSFCLFTTVQYLFSFKLPCGCMQCLFAFPKQVSLRCFQALKLLFGFCPSIRSEML